MITDHNMSLNFIKKEDLTGSYQGMCYIFQKQEEDQMQVTIWPEPYCLVKTEEEKKIKKMFPLTEEGKMQAIGWMNEEYQDKIKIWKNTPNY